MPAHSFITLLADLGTMALNKVTLPSSPDHAIPLLAKPTKLQNRTFRLLKIDHPEDVAM